MPKILRLTQLIKRMGHDADGSGHWSDAPGRRADLKPPLLSASALFSTVLASHQTMCAGTGKHDCLSGLEVKVLTRCLSVLSQHLTMYCDLMYRNVWVQLKTKITINIHSSK